MTSLCARATAAIAFVLASTTALIGPAAAQPTTCMGEAATIVGTSDPDVIVGTSGPDVIVALAGDDVIRAMEGDDIICAGPGDDTVYAFAGDDEVFGEAGDDLVFGQGGDDVLRGGSGDDDMRAGPGDDRVLGEAGNDRLLGNPGRDTLQGGPGDDKVTGGPDDDDVAGGSGSDFVRGGFGHDLVRGQGGDDLVLGSSGRDRVLGGGGDDRVVGHLGRDVVDGGPGIDLVLGGGGPDTLFGGADSDTLDGGGDIDACSGDGGFDTAVNCESGENEQPTGEPGQIEDITLVCGPTDCTVTWFLTGPVDPAANLTLGFGPCDGVCDNFAQLETAFSATTFSATASIADLFPQPPAIEHCGLSAADYVEIDGQRSGDTFASMCGAARTDGFTVTTNPIVQAFGSMAVTAPTVVDLEAVNCAGGVCDIEAEYVDNTRGETGYQVSLVAQFGDALVPLGFANSDTVIDGVGTAVPVFIPMVDLAEAEGGLLCLSVSAVNVDFGGGASSTLCRPVSGGVLGPPTV